MAEDAPRRQPTLDEVTELAGVSRSVASRAINNAPHVSRAEREAVERAVRRLGYVPDPTARALAARPTGAAAPVVSGEDPSIFANPFFDQVIGRSGEERPASDAVSGRLRPEPQAGGGAPSVRSMSALVEILLDACARGEVHTHARMVTTGRRDAPFHGEEGPRSCLPSSSRRP